LIGCIYLGVSKIATTYTAMKAEQKMANCMLNLKVIANAMNLYYETYHSIPEVNNIDNLMVLLKLNTKDFYSCDDNIAFQETLIYNKDMRVWRNENPVPMIWDRMGKHGECLHVLYSDGVVRILNSDTLFTQKGPRRTRSLLYDNILIMTI